MKLAYVTAWDARDRSKWSGLGYYMARALEQQSHTVEYVGPLRVSQRWYLWAKKQLYARGLKKRYLPDRDPPVAKGFARQASRRLSRLAVDIVFSPGTVPIAYLESEQPIVFWTDSTFAGMVDFYPEFTNLCRETLQNGTALEAAALERAALAVYSSEWAAQTAIQSYGVAQTKVHVVPFGANIDETPTLDVVRGMVAARSTRVCKLLFLGVAWFRKGGDIALEVARELNAAGLPTELMVVGCKPRIPGPRPHFVRYGGTISKSSPTRVIELKALMAESHFLVLPSRADCTPVVFNEANAFGVPCLATAVGGIASIIRNGVNGSTFARDAAISTYCEYIWTHFSDLQAYRDLALSSFREYETRLNWSVAGRTVSELMANLAT
jgi:glycosyltransferase involved in cell wall biosynthesis